MDVKARHDVFERGEMLEQSDFLKRAGDAVAHAPMGGEAAEFQSIEHDAAGIGRVNAAYQIEQRRLAGAVRADDGKHRAGRHGERDVAHGVDAAETSWTGGRRAAALPHLARRTG